MLKQLEALKAPAPTPAIPGATSQDTAALFLKDLTAFPKTTANLSPEETAKAWLDLYERSLKLQPTGASVGFAGTASRSVFTALPGPAAWPALRKLVENRESAKQPNPAAAASLRLILDTLTNDEERQWADLPALATAPALTRQRFYYGEDEGSSFMVLGTALSEMSNQPAQVEKFWDATLTGMEHSTGTSQFSLPDLVTILGEAKAEPLVLRALLLPSGQIQKISGYATQSLARKLALANIDKLPRPPWVLTKTLEGAPLYAALLKKFPNDGGNQPYAIYYLLALVTQGHPEEAAKVDVGIDMSQLSEATEQIAEEGWQPQVYDFVHTYLGLHPETGLWEFYVELASQTGQSADALKFIQDTAARTDISATAHEQVQSVLYQGLLAVDKVDEGIAALQALIKSQTPQTTSSTANAAPPSGLSAFISNVSLALASQTGQSTDAEQKIIQWNIQLARLGHLLKREDIEKEGLDGAIKIYLQPPSAQSSGYESYYEGEVVSYLIETGRYAQAENLLIKKIVQDSSVNVPGGERYRPDQNRENLLKLATVYYEAGRWADIITLLQKAPGWGARDLITIASESARIERRSTPHLDLITARALAETGHVDDALPILNYALQEDSGDDAAYELLLKIGKGDLVAQLDALYRLDQFQERPLIWKAVVLLQQGKTEEAEAACKAAIAVDPSDGEEGKGDRMRVYSVMADVCDAKKDTKQAEFFRNVVKAIRLSEDADDYYDAGLLTQAVAMYNHALTLFSDAYCIQSRIARQLSELGRTEEAAVHYRKAFELMPVSFGRLESHCFGCERAFKGKTAVDIATKTFTEMMAKDPKKPQIPYLLGYLYMEQDQFPEALANFQKAAALDPDYINAWRHIVEIGEEYQLSPEVRDDAVLNLLRLDPAGRHVKPRTDYVRQLDKLWAAEETAAAAMPPKPRMLYHLDVSASDAGSDNGDFDFGAGNGLDDERQAWAKLQNIGVTLGRSYYYYQKRSSPLDTVLANKIILTALGFQ